MIDDLKSYKNCITMANSGLVGSCFNKEISNSTIDKIKLILPVDENNNPNWNYMENYTNKIANFQRDKLLGRKAS